jgi:hypothetical protein
MMRERRKTLPTKVCMQGRCSKLHFPDQHPVLSASTASLHFP